MNQLIHTKLDYKIDFAFMYAVYYQGCENSTELDEVSIPLELFDSPLSLVFIRVLADWMLLASSLSSLSRKFHFLTSSNPTLASGSSQCAIACDII